MGLGPPDTRGSSIDPWTLRPTARLGAIQGEEEDCVMPMTRRRRLLVLPALGLLTLVLLGAASATSPVTPMPGELILTEAQQAQALGGMPAEERERLQAVFDDPEAFLPVAYTRAFYRVVPDGQGGERVEQVGSYEDPKSQLRIPSTLTAASSGTGGAYDLYISVAVWRTSTTGVYEWGIESYFDWRGSNGADFCNQNVDRFGTSWAGDLYLSSDNWNGKYNTIDGVTNDLDLYRSDATPNEGVGWAFHEWKPWVQTSCVQADWGRAAAYIRETSWAGRTDNVVHRYFHTKGTTSYSLSFYNASITITPGDSNQWSAAAYADFSH